MTLLNSGDRKQHEGPPLHAVFCPRCGAKLRAGPEPLTVYCYSCGPLFVGRTLPKLATNDVHHTSPRRSVIERELRGDEIAKAMRGARS